MTLPIEYNYIKNNSSKLLTKALEYYGFKEAPGSADNPTIMKWAHDFGITWYLHDSTAWCSLFLGEMAHECGFTPPDKNSLLAAISWVNWGGKIVSPFLGVIMVFNRPGGHHVGLYVGEDAESYHVLGGNTGDAVAIAKLAKDRLIAMRWPSVEPIPPDTKRIYVDIHGKLSENES